MRITEKKKNVDKVINKGKRKLVKAWQIAMAWVWFVLVSANTIYAEDTTGTGEAASTASGADLWTSIMNFLQTWVERLGIAVAGFGLIEIGFGWANNNPDAKSQGIKFAMGGCIIFAVGKFIFGSLA